MRQGWFTLWLLLLSWGYGWALEVKLPKVALTGVPFTVEVSELPKDMPLQVEFLTPEGGRSLTQDLSKSTEIRLERAGTYQWRWQAGEARGEGTLRVLPAWWSVVPPLLAIVLALALRQVLLALFFGIWGGCWMLFGGDPFSAGLRAVDTYLLNAYADTDHLHIVLFSFLLGGLVGLISRSGGMRALVRAMSRRVRSARGVQLSTYLMGLVIFFDDYANTLFVGATMRPLADRFRISREKLAYLIDSTSAPVANLALISTWIGFEVSLIAESFKASGVQMEPYWAFLMSLPYRFYPILALVFVALIVWMGRDFGAMYRAEVRARTTGKVLSDTASPLASYESVELLPPDHLRGKVWMVFVPLLSALGLMLGGLIYTGYTALEPNDPVNLRTLLAGADSYKALLWGSAVGCGVAILLFTATRTLSLREALDAWLGGMRSMFLAVVMLGLAWAIGSLTGDLYTAQFIVQALGDNLSPYWLPALTTLVAGVISFSTGSSWATMSIVMPLVIPLALTVSQGLGAEQQTFFVITTLSSVLAGATFGDHCSPISDTTVLSSIFSGSDHIDHVRTQLPYALVVGAVAWVTGDIATAYGLSPWIALPLGALILALIVRFVGKPVPPSGEGEESS